MSTINEVACELARRNLRDVFEHGGSIAFDKRSIELGLVQDVTPGKSYDLVQDEHGDYHFIDNVSERNYAGSPNSMVYLEYPTGTHSCPF